MKDILKKNPINSVQKYHKKISDLRREGQREEGRKEEANNGVREKGRGAGKAEGTGGGLSAYIPGFLISSSVQ